jgi:hypothetical protein
MAKKRSPVTKRLLPVGLGVCSTGLILVVVLRVYGPRWVRAINATNPLLLAFLVSFRVVNESGEAVEFVPIGMTTGSGWYSPLPRYQDLSPPAVAITNPEPISLEPGEETQVVYDYDDVNFRHLLIRDGRGNIYVLDTDKKGTKRAAYGPQKDRYAIPELRHLSPAPRALHPCLYGKRVKYDGAKEYP